VKNKREELKPCLLNKRKEIFAGFNNCKKILMTSGRIVCIYMLRVTNVTKLSITLEDELKLRGISFASFRSVSTKPGRVCYFT